MNIYFHIGVHKTGSSLLQQRIFPKMKDVYYIPRTDSSKLKKYIQYADDFNFDPLEGKAIFNNIKNIENHDSVLISDEEFYGNPYWSNIDRKRNIDRIVAIFGLDVKLILFIRNQKSLINSLYNQYVKTGGMADFSSFLNQKKFPLHVNTAYFCFDKYIEYIETTVGKQNYKIILFEDFMKEKENTVNGLFQFLGNNEIQLHKSDFKKTNPSLKNNFIPLLRFFNKFTKSPKNPFHWLHYYVQVAFRKLFSMLGKLPLKEKKYQFTNLDTIEEIKHSNRKLQTQFNLNLEKYNYPL